MDFVFQVVHGRGEFVELMGNFVVSGYGLSHGRCWASSRHRRDRVPRNGTQEKPPATSGGWPENGSGVNTGCPGRHWKHLPCGRPGTTRREAARRDSAPGPFQRPKQTAPCKITPAATADGRPTLSVPALLSVLAWYRRRTTLHGGDPCPARSVQSPPAPSAAESSLPGVDQPLAGAAGGSSSANAAGSSPRPCPTAPRVASRRGGDA